MTEEAAGHKPPSGIKEISRGELIHEIHTGTRFILVDVLDHEHFLRVHLPGAINIPLQRMRELAPVLFGKQDKLIIYCANFQCPTSATAVNILQQLGFTDVWHYAGGIRDWEEGELPVVRGDAQTD